MVKNEAKIKNPILEAVREQLEHRALWLYYLTDEAKKKGLDPYDFAADAIRRCGHFNGQTYIRRGKTDSLKGLKKTLFTIPAQLVFEMKIIDVQDDRFELKFHYCPLVKAWQKAGCTDEEIKVLCDLAMCGDRGIGDKYGAKLDLPKTIGNGDDICHLIYHK